MAYNICYTTCLGRIESIGKEGSFKFGCGIIKRVQTILLIFFNFFFKGSLFIPDSLIKSLDLDKDIYVAPNGIAFVKPHIRQGIFLNIF